MQLKQNYYWRLFFWWIFKEANHHPLPAPVCLVYPSNPSTPMRNNIIQQR